MNLTTFFSPEEARLLPEQTKQKVLASLALKRLWHTVFDACPKLLLVDSPDAKKIFEGFLIWASERRLSMDWTLHMHLLDWFCHKSQWRNQMNQDIVKECLCATAMRWVRSDVSENKGVLIGSKFIPNLAVAGWKSEHPKQSPRFVLVKLPPQDSCSSYGAACIFCAVFCYPKTPLHWEALVK